MAKPEFIVVGAGPAGAAAAARLARLGYSVTVYEAHERLAVKPCGMGIPAVEDLPVAVPKDSVLAEVRGVKLYVDGEPAVEIHGRVNGYIVDKSRMLESIIVESGAELVTRSFYDVRRRSVKTRGSRVDLDRWSGRILLAGGWAYYPGEKIAAVQVHGRVKDLEPDVLEIMFDTELIGYYWIFPLGDKRRAEIGVGGYADPRKLIDMLNAFIKRSGRVEGVYGPPQGALIAVGGVNARREGPVYLVGEAAGFVLPLTGEGIRPAMISGWAAAEALASGRDPVKAQLSTRIARAIRVQRRILEYVKRLPATRRRELLLSIPEDVHIEVSLGSLRTAKIARALASRPRLASRLLRIIAAG
ncbi:NAD(P)-binding protein [Stetteria hydrogenophila]